MKAFTGKQTKNFSRTGLFLVIFSVMLLTVRAEMGSGTYTNDFGEAIRLWDISGSYTESNGNESESYTINMDANGALTGEGTFNYNDSTNMLIGDFTLAGSMKSIVGVQQANLILTIPNGTGTVQAAEQNIPVTFTASLKENLYLNTGARKLIGKAGGKLVVTTPFPGKTKSKSIPLSDAFADLSDAVDGHWGLSLTIATNGTSYVGKGTVYLSNGKSFDLNLTGSYSSKTDLSKLVLKSPNPNFSMNLNLISSFTGAQMNIQSLRGEVLGQKLLLKP